ncbi:MMPL family transporter [Motilibacter deserti]|uniref:MMPL family transporter n=1 Tax=Motilibacter deserti TaxID=2714956 RepID=UPI002F2B8871
MAGPHADRRTTARALSPVGRARSWWVLLLALLASGAVFALGPGEATTVSDAASGLADGAQSTRVAQLQERLPGSGVAPVIAVYARDDGGALGQDGLAAVEAAAQRLAGLAAGGGRPAEPEVSEDGTVATVTLPVSTDEDTVEDDVGAVRTAARAGLPDGVGVEVTGGPAYAVDLSAVFDGANTKLLSTTAAVVALLLLVTYRSPVLWLVPLLVVGVADRLATVVVGALAPRAGVDVDGSAAGILSVLVFGAGTNYALLLVSRYRDTLRHESDRFAAMRRALRSTAPAVLASGGTVLLSLLTLLLADLTSNRGLGFACAVGIVIAMAFGLVVLPAALVLPGRWLFWPLVPRVVDSPDDDEAGLWSAVGRRVARRPGLVAALGVAVLAVLAVGALAVQTELSAEERFRNPPEAVLGQQSLQRAFPAGTTQPLTVVSSAGAAEAVVETAQGVQGVARARSLTTEGEFAVAQVVLEDAPGTEGSDRAIEGLRDALAEVAGADALVGGTTAEEYDTARATERDTRLVVPLVLLLVLLVLTALLRSAVAPVLLVATVVASYFASLGASWWAFDLGYGFPALDTPVPLLSFLFLVALGVDYNIFLVARTREEVLAGRATREAVLRALAATGGVITSAGILLASVFAVLGVLPLITLTQIGVVVGIGVLLDTLLVRTVVVPALVLVLGERFWWPSRPERVRRPRPPSPRRSPA